MANLKYHKIYWKIRKFLVNSYFLWDQIPIFPPKMSYLLPFLSLDTLLSLQTEYCIYRFLTLVFHCVFVNLTRMGSALLSRFDLVFIILDKPDEDLDSLLSEHVMTLHCGKKRTFNTSVLREVSDESSCNEDIITLCL